MSAADDLIQELKAAADGLLYPSESDEPFTGFVWPKGWFESPRKAVEKNAGKSPVTSQTIDEFFTPLSSLSDVDRFKALRGLLEKRLSKLSVFRVGERQVDVYLIGSANRQWIGLKTRSIET
jgi:hypothetical protein